MATRNIAQIIKADGTEVDLDHKPTYEEAKKIIGGYIEVAYGRDHLGTFQLLVDEDGIPRDLPFNPKATRIYRQSPIHGDVILLRGWRFA